MSGIVVTIRGREFQAEVVPTDPGQPGHVLAGIDGGRPTYRLTGKRGAVYFTVRNRPNPDMMFLLRDGPGFGQMRDVWLTDKDGTLREAHTMRVRW